MSDEKYVYGIASIKFGTPTGTNTMPAVLTPWAQTVAGSFTISEAEAQTKDFKVEEATTAVKTIVTDVGSLSGQWRAYDLTPAIIAVVKGGTAAVEGAGATKMNTYAAPVSISTRDLALEVTTLNGVVINIYKAAVLARFDGGIGRENLLEMEVRATAQDPGNGASPFMMKLPAPEA